MAGADDLAKLGQSTQKEIASVVLPPFPPYPKEVKDRFPSMAQHEEAVKKWVKDMTFNIRGQG